MTTNSVVNLNFDITLSDERIILRPMERGDFEDFAKISQESEIWKYFPGNLANEDELREWMNRAFQEKTGGTRIPFTLRQKSTGEVIGSSSIGNISLRDSRAEIGWTWISPHVRGKGVNDRMKFLMMQYCFETLRLERVEFKTDVLNIFARTALKRIGATEEGILRSHTLMNFGRRRDTIYYSVLKAEWEKVSQTLSQKITSTFSANT